MNSSGKNADAISQSEAADGSLKGTLGTLLNVDKCGQNEKGLHAGSLDFGGPCED